MPPVQPTDTAPAAAAAAWQGLDEAWQRALQLGWEAFQTGNIGVGAVVTDRAGTIVSASRNRVSDATAPPGEVCGSSVAHAEINALATLAYRQPRELTLTTSLQPCLHCTAAIRQAPVERVRFAGADPLWDGCDDLTGLNSWVARRAAVPAEGPLPGPVGLFATLMARFGPGLVPHVAEALEAAGEEPLLALVDRLTGRGQLEALRRLSVDAALAALWTELTQVAATMDR